MRITPIVRPHPDRGQCCHADDSCPRRRSDSRTAQRGSASTAGLPRENPGKNSRNTVKTPTLRTLCEPEMPRSLLELHATLARLGRCVLGESQLAPWPSLTLRGLHRTGVCRQAGLPRTCCEFVDVESELMVRF